MKKIILLTISLLLIPTLSRSADPITSVNDGDQWMILVRNGSHTNRPLPSNDHYYNRVFAADGTSTTTGNVAMYFNQYRTWQNFECVEGMWEALGGPGSDDYGGEYYWNGYASTHLLSDPPPLSELLPECVLDPCAAAYDNAVILCDNDPDKVIAIDPYEACTYGCVNCEDLRPSALEQCPEGILDYSCRDLDSDGDGVVDLVLEHGPICKSDTCETLRGNCTDKCGVGNFAFDCVTFNGLPDVYQDCVCIGEQTKPPTEIPEEGDTDNDLLGKLLDNSSTLSDSLFDQLSELNLTNDQIQSDSSDNLDYIKKRDSDNIEDGLEEITTSESLFDDAAETLTSGYYDDVIEKINAEAIKDYSAQYGADNPLFNSSASNAIGNITQVNSVTAQDMTFIFTPEYQITIEAKYFNLIREFLFFAFSFITLISCFNILTSVINPPV